LSYKRVLQCRASASAQSVSTFFKGAYKMAVIHYGHIWSGQSGGRPSRCQRIG